MVSGSPGEVGDVSLRAPDAGPSVGRLGGGEAGGGPAPGEPGNPDGAVSHVWSIYYRQGFDEGYRRAVKDLLASLVSISERFIGEKPESAGQVRKVLYPFEEYLEKQIGRMTPEDGFVEGGMGI